MSLINDALKKAQKQRTGEAPALGSLPSVGGESARSISRRSKSSGPNLLLLGGIAAAVVVIGGGTWFALSGKPAASPQPATPPALTATAPSPVAKPRDESAVGPAKADTFILQTAPLPEVARQTSGQTPGSQQGTTVQPPSSPVARPRDEPAIALTPAGGPLPVSAVPPPKLDARPLDPVAIQYLDNIKVAGIRASATDAKVLMNDRVYRIGSVVSGEMGLRLVGITANTLTFEDAAGGRYTRTF
jgi:hypothetical protein